MGLALGIIATSHIVQHGDPGLFVFGLYFFGPAAVCLWQAFRTRRRPD
jgi:hypothetical protein